jgi:hypothetical protein
MRALPLPRRIAFALPALLALLAACTQRPAAIHLPGHRKPPVVAPASPPASAASAASAPLADPERDAVVFESWRRKHAADVDAFETYLVHEQVAQVVPTYQLLRSASMWKECHAEPFELPPPQNWQNVRDLLILLRELKKQGVLPQFEVVSAYRDPHLNRCAGGAPGSSHQLFAVDIAPLSRAEGDRLCSFWHQQGPHWSMGVSRYPTGRIHIDRNGWRTWGASYHRGSSYCLGAS